MGDLATYLTFIGAMNLLGVLVLAAALHEEVMDAFLRRWTWIYPRSSPPLRHGPGTRAWLWWATIGSGFFGAINLLAADWPVAPARAVAWGDVYAYGAFEVLALGMTLSRRFGPGVWICHVLWLAQGGWGVWVLM